MNSLSRLHIPCFSHHEVLLPETPSGMEDSFMYGGRVPSSTGRNNLTSGSLRKAISWCPWLLTQCYYPFFFPLTMSYESSDVIPSLSSWKAKAWSMALGSLHFCQPLFFIGPFLPKLHPENLKLPWGTRNPPHPPRRSLVAIPGLTYMFAFLLRDLSQHGKLLEQIDTHVAVENGSLFQNVCHTSL